MGFFNSLSAQALKIFGLCDAIYAAKSIKELFQKLYGESDSSKVLSNIVYCFALVSFLHA